ncbi:transposase [Paenibacillus sp. FSL R10-2199]|uniref:transposase n=1 Tax=Paenibacillus sp. FSL R10-2199 TaxID=2975348 RepID=UPI004046F8AF
MELEVLSSAGIKEGHQAFGIILCAGRKNVTQIQQAAKGNRHLSNTTNFLNHSPWCVNRMQRRRMDRVMNQIRAKQAKSGDQKFVFLIVDDTCCKKRQVDEEDGGTKLPVFP